MPTFQIRLSVQERERLGELARAEKLSMSALIRKRLGLEERKRWDLKTPAESREKRPDPPPVGDWSPASGLPPLEHNTLLACPMPGCLYHAQSSKARCPVHNRQVR